MMLLGILLALGLVQGSQGNALAYANRVALLWTERRADHVKKVGSN